MSLDAIMREDRRLVILRCLAEDADYSINDSILRDVLAGFGHGVPADALRGDLAWLAEQGLVTVEELALPAGRVLLVARLSERGADVAAGRAVAPGVKRPRPGV